MLAYLIGVEKASTPLMRVESRRLGILEMEYPLAIFSAVMHHQTQLRSSVESVFGVDGRYHKI